MTEAFALTEDQELFRREWRRLFERAGFVIVEDEVYERTEAGWRSAGAADAEGCLCVELGQRGVLAQVRRLLRRLHG